MPKLLTEDETRGGGLVSFISWRRLAELLHDPSATTCIKGFALRQDGGLTIYLDYVETDEVDDDA